MARLAKGKIKIDITKIRKECGNVTIALTEIKRIIREHYEKLYANKLGNLDEIDNLMEAHKLPKLTQEEIENLNKPIRC